MSTSDDPTPFALVGTRLVDGLRDCPELTRLVKVRNWVRYDRAEPRPDRPSATNADLPDLEVRCVGIASTGRTSTSFAPNLAFQIRLRTDSLRFNADDGLGAVLWWTYVAIERVRERNYGGLEYIRDTIFSDAAIGTSEGEQEPDSAPLGWQSLLRLQVRCSFTKAQWGVLPGVA